LPKKERFSTEDPLQKSLPRVCKIPNCFPKYTTKDVQGGGKLATLRPADTEILAEKGVLVTGVGGGQKWQKPTANAKPGKNTWEITGGNFPNPGGKRT